MRKKGLAVWGLILLALGGLITYRVLAAPKERRTITRGKMGEPIPVRVIRVTPSDMEQYLDATGDILPLLQVDLLSKVPGYLEQITVHPGDRVSTNQVVATIERTELLYRVRETEAKVARVRAQLAEQQAGARPEEIAQAEEAARQARSRHEDAKINLERNRDLFRGGLISKKGLDEAELIYTLTQAQFNSAQNQLKLIREGVRLEVRQAVEAQLGEAEALLAQEQTRLQNTRIIAPFSGVITKRFVDPGALLSTSTPILTLVSADAVKVQLNIQERDIPQVSLGMPATIQVDAHPQRSFNGRVARLNSALDLSSRTLQAEVHIPNPAGLLKPGMFARLQLLLQVRRGVLAVPSEAILEEAGESSLFIVQGQQAVKRQVTPGLRQGNLLEVSGDLQAGAMVVVVGQHRLKPGSQVTIIGADTTKAVGG